MLFIAIYESEFSLLSQQKQLISWYKLYVTFSILFYAIKTFYTILNSVAYELMEAGDFQKANIIYSRALKGATELNNITIIGNICNNVGILYLFIL